jgi:hypothetical protein
LLIRVRYMDRSVSGNGRVGSLLAPTLSPFAGTSLAHAIHAASPSRTRARMFVAASPTLVKSV